MKKITTITTILLTIIMIGCKEGNVSPEPQSASEIKQEQSEAREKKIDYALSQLKDMVKKQMKDPDSFEMIDRAWDKKDTANVVKLVIKYRANNSFGGKVESTTFGVYDLKNETVTITKTE